MPYCEASKYHENGAKIFYRRYGHGRTKLLLIIGFAGTHESWRPQIHGLTGTHEPQEEEDDEATAVTPEFDGTGEGDSDCHDEEKGEEELGIEVCCFDNRGMGRSSVPTNKADYTTTIMARDALALMDHLSWKKAHVVGHSMGGMISCKLAAIAPDRLCSLALLNVTGGGFECFPKIDRQMLSLAFRFLRARTPEERAFVDLDTHYTREYLDEYVGLDTRRSILYQEYVKGLSSAGMQSNSGFKGQVNACWTHKLTPKELQTIRSSGFLVSVIHGSQDIVAQLSHAKRLAEKLSPATRMVELHGAHLVSHERPNEVNLSLIELINASDAKLDPRKWSNIPEADPGCLVSLSATSGERGTALLLDAYGVLGSLQIRFLYFLSLFAMALQHLFRMARVMKPVKVAVASDL